MAARPAFPLERHVLAQVRMTKKAVNVCSAGRYLSLTVAPCGLCNKENRALQKIFCRACHEFSLS